MTTSTRADVTAHCSKPAPAPTNLLDPRLYGASSPRRYFLRERRSFDARPPPLGFCCGVWRAVPRREGWVGGRLIITESIGGPTLTARESLPGAAAEAESLTAAAEALYRARLPGLSVIQETQGGSRSDFVLDSITHSAGAVTSVLQTCAGEGHSAYVDGGDEATLAGAITLRVRSGRFPPAAAYPASESLCFDCGMADCDGGCADLGRQTGGGCDGDFADTRRPAGGQARYGEVLACAVNSRHARGGVGRLLVAWATANAAAEGLSFLLVSASTDVVCFWEKLGWRAARALCRGVREAQARVRWVGSATPPSSIRSARGV
jgi:GNAT superfamily N-acetyltransferase